MKLFGNKKHPSHTARSRAKSKRAWPVALCALALVLVAGFAAYKISVRPIARPAQQTQDVKPTQTPEISGESAEETPQPEQTDADAEEAVETVRPSSFRDGVYNILICGTDGDGYRTDTIMIAHLDVNTHETALMSVPRDTVVETQSGGLMKINSVYAGGGESGVQRLRERLNTLLGFPVDGYFLVDLEAFEKAVDLLGGVWFDVPQDMYYEDASQDLHIDLKAGYQLLDGKSAMGLVRYRKGYASQDIQRTKVQQEFLRALAKQCISLKSLSKLSELAAVFTEYVQTDLSLGNMLYFAKELMQCDLDEMQSCTVEGEGATINGISYYPLYDWSVLQLVNAYFNPYDTPITAENIYVVTPELAKSHQKPTQSEMEPPDEENGDFDPEMPDDEDFELEPDLDFEPIEDDLTPPDEPSDEITIPDDIPTENDPSFWNEDNENAENR